LTLSPFLINLTTPCVKIIFSSLLLTGTFYLHHIKIQKRLFAINLSSISIVLFAD
jgi:hypothetical protein